MPGNQWKKELLLGVPAGENGTSLVPLPKLGAYPTPSLTYDTSRGTNLDLKITNAGINSVTTAYQSAVYLPDKQLVYVLPGTSSRQSIKYDPATDVATLFGPTGLSQAGFVRAPNGFVYGIPSALAAAKVQKFDPSTETYTAIGPAADATVNKWFGGVLAPNGCIYGIPLTKTTVLKIDPTTDTVTEFGSLAATTTKWRGGVLAPNGKIYCIPYSVSSVLVIDPSNDTTSTFGDVTKFIGNGATGTYYSGGCLGPDGKIYCTPYGAKNTLVIDPETNTLSSCDDGLSSGGTGGTVSLSTYVAGLSFEGPYRTAAGFQGVFFGVLAGNGKIYSSAANWASGVPNVNPRLFPMELDLTTRSSNRLAPCSGNGSLAAFAMNGTTPYLYSLLLPDGSILYVPYGATGFMRLTGLPHPPPDAFTLPSNLANLASSAYNRHVNR